MILACRNTEAGNAAKRDIESSTSCSKHVLQVWELDLSSYDSVQAFADRAAKALPRIDVVIENAGISTLKWRLAEGNESTLTVNVISTFLLALLLLPKLKQTAVACNVRPSLVIVSSDLACVARLLERKHAESGFLLDALNNQSWADMQGRYQNSKLLEVLVVRRMAQLRPAESYPVTIDNVTPGFCDSELTREINKGIMKYALYALKAIMARTTEVGSREYLHAAGTGAEEDMKLHGQFVWGSKPAQLIGIPASVDSDELGARLWDELCQKLEKIRPGVTANL